MGGAQVIRFGSLEKFQYSVQRPGLNKRLEVHERLFYHPNKVVFASNYDRNGRIADDKQRILSQASLSSDGFSVFNFANQKAAQYVNNINKDGDNLLENGSIINEKEQKEESKSHHSHSNNEDLERGQSPD